jgi:hypothetical protein
MGRTKIRIPSTLKSEDVVSDKYMRDAGHTTGSNRTLSLCRALGQIYINTEDEEVKLKLLYSSSIAKYYVYKIREFETEWVNNFCPRFMDYDGIMKNENESLPGEPSPSSD